MALYIFNDHEMPSFISLKTQFEISKLKSLNTKRIVTKTIRHISYMSIMTEDPDAVFLIPEMNPSLTDCIVFCNRHNIPVIVLHISNSYMPFLNFSGIYGNAYENMRLVLKYCIGAGKKRLALFGFNNVFWDRQYAEAIYNLYPDFNQKDFFQLTTTFEDCFESFFSLKDNYDSILFPNDLIAIAFIQKMNQLDRKYAENRFILGISDMNISKLFFTTITSITYGLDDVLHAVSSIYRSLLRRKNNNSLISVNYQLPPKLFIRDSTHNTPLTATDAVLPRVTEMRKPPLFFEDVTVDYSNEPILGTITMLENLFSSCDKTDFQILLCLLNNMTNAEISKKLFITPQALQYHYHQMFALTGTENKKVFINLISRYISKENLDTFLKTSVIFLD